MKLYILLILTLSLALPITVMAQDSGDTVVLDFAGTPAFWPSGPPLATPTTGLYYMAFPGNTSTDKGHVGQVQITSGVGVYTEMWTVPCCTATPLDSPQGPLVIDTAGIVYGTTAGSVLSGECCGTVYKLTKSGSTWTQSTIYTFTGGAAGKTPQGGVVMDSSGNMYGVTFQGGDATCNCGMVYKLTKAGVFTSLHNFVAGEGANPKAPLTLSTATDFQYKPQIHLFGTTTTDGANGFGTVFMTTISTSGDPLDTKILYSFGGGTTDVAAPTGQLYFAQDLMMMVGLAPSGGAHGCGGVYAIYHNPLTGTGWVDESLIYSFNNTTADGCGPTGNLIADTAGNLYFTAPSGGASGTGAVLKLTLTANGTYTEKIIHSFANNFTDGKQPTGGLAFSGSNVLVGTTTFGGPNSCFGNTCGTVFTTPNN